MCITVYAVFATFNVYNIYYVYVYVYALHNVNVFPRYLVKDTR